MGIFTRSNSPSTCWVIYFESPDATATTMAALRPVAVTLTEKEAWQLLDQMLVQAPGRNNLVEDYPYYPSERMRERASLVHLVIYLDEDGPTVSGGFESSESAIVHARKLRRLGADGVSIADMKMNTLPA